VIVMMSRSPPALLLAACLPAFAAMPGPAQAFGLTSTDLDAAKPVAGAFVFDGGGCSGDNLSPQLAWSGAPAGTRSFALTVFDPDAPNGGAGFWHWAVFDIPAGVAALPRGAGAADGHALPQGARQVANDYGTPGYGGPCPPAGKPHRYLFELYALKVPTLGLAAEVSPAEAAAQIRQAAIGKATLTVRYGR
jgi:Raf kinase inhibitor-like YbhB/YbcL family protein